MDIGQVLMDAAGVATGQVGAAVPIVAVVTAAYLAHKYLRYFIFNELR